MSEVQELVDEIAVALGSGVSLDDLTGRLIAYSTHRQRADDARVRALLERRSPENVRSWEIRHGVATATRPLVVPGNADLGMSPRVCVPLLHRGVRTGLLFVISEERVPTTENAARIAARISDQTEVLAALLYEASSPHLDERRIKELDFLEACQGDAGAAARLTHIAGTGAAGQSLALVVTLHHTMARKESGAGDRRYPQERVIAHQVINATTGVLAHAVTATHVVLLLRHRDLAPINTGREAGPHGVQEVHRRLREAFRPPVQEGVGGECAEVTAAETTHVSVAGETSTGYWLVRDLSQVGLAYTRALTAAQAAAVDPGLGEVVAWDDCGIYRILGQLGDPMPTSPLFAMIEDLPNPELLLSTLEAVYDHPGGVQDVAGELHLHRTSLYYRINKVRDLLGADPLTGQVRAELHLALKARRWAARPRI